MFYLKSFGVSSVFCSSCSSYTVRLQAIIPNSCAYSPHKCMVLAHDISMLHRWKACILMCFISVRNRHIFFKVLHELDQCAGGHRLYIRENVVCLFIEYRSMFWGWPKLPLVGCIFAHNPFHYLVKAEQENITFWLKYSNMSVKIWSVVHVRHNCMWMKCIQNLVFFFRLCIHVVLIWSTPGKLSMAA